MKIEEVGHKAEETAEVQSKGLFFSDQGRMERNLDHVIFEDLPKLANGIRFLSLDCPLDVINDLDVFKMRIANPVRSSS